MDKHKKLASAVVVGLGSIFLLAGCSQFSPLPDEERYQYINEVKANLDYASTGDVVEERYDDGVFSPSFFRAEIEGEKTFDAL